MGRTAVFIDRDGVINVNRDLYVKTWDEFEFLPGVLDALALLAKAGLPVYVVTNQSCIGRGLTTLEEVLGIHERMREVIDQHGGRIDEVVMCPHRPSEGCSCRKPKPGMLLDIAARHDIDLSASYFIGDATSDAEIALAVGAQPILLLPGPGRKGYDGQLVNSLNANVWFADDLEAAVKRIIAHTGQAT